MPRSQVAVFVDGANLHHRLRQCGWPSRADIGALGRRLVGDRELAGVWYYNVPPPPHLSRAQIHRQERYYDQIRQDEGVQVKLGYLQRRVVEGAAMYEEKGVDVNLAVDMLTGAFLDSYDTAILVSSDGDFRPLVEAVRGFGKRVEYLFFPNTFQSYALVHACNIARKCRRAWIAELGS